MLAKDFVDELTLATHGAKMPRVEWDYVGSLKIAFPTLEIQQKTVQYLDNLTGHIDDLLNRLYAQLDILREYESSLIYHHVTGKITV